MNNSHKHGRDSVGREKSSGLSTFKKFTVVSVVGLAAAVSVMSAASDSRVAYITDGDVTYTVTTVDTDTNGIIEKAGIELGNYDEAIVTEQSGERIDINIVRAFPVKISVDGGTKLLDVTGGTVAQALKLAKVNTSANDFITPEPSSELKEDTEIKVVRGVKIYLTCDGETKAVYVPQGKVSDALEYVGYRLTAEDSLNVDENALVEKGMSVNVDKILTRTTTATRKIEPKVIVEPCDTLPLGEKKVKQEGKEGTAEVTYKEKYVNGVLEGKDEVSNKILTNAVDRIVLIGTKEEKSELTVKKLSNEIADTDSDSGFEDENSFKSNAENNYFEEDYEDDFEDETNSEETSGIDSGLGFTYSNVIVGSCTAYTELDGITAIGTIPRVGTVAVNPNVIPYGTRLYICSADGSYVYGYAVAEDTGTAAMAGDIIVDLYMNSEEECVAFGRQNLCVYILD